MYLGMEATINSLQKDFYPQKYFLEGEACKYFGQKLRTYRRWIEDGEIIPGRFKVKGSNYYVIEPVAFHKFLIEHKLEEGKYEPKRTIQSQSIRNSAVKRFLHRNGGIGTTTGGLGVLAKSKAQPFNHRAVKVSKLLW